MLPFPLMGWVDCIADTAHDWLFSGILDNAHSDPGGDFAEAESVQHRGALLIGTYDRFTDGDPVGYLRNLNDHMPRKDENELIFIERTGHTYQQKEKEMAGKVAETVRRWRDGAEGRSVS